MIGRKALAKDSLREIRFSFSRFISIFAIIALGAGFFAGIKATCPDMKETAHKYFKDNNLADIKFVSSIGISASDVSAINEVEGISGVMPSYTADLFLTVGEKNIELRAISYNSKLKQNDIYNLNRPVLLEGRMPEKSGECVVEKKFSSPKEFAVGNTITLSSPYEEKSIDEFIKTVSYKIVGIVCSPSYVGYKRGSTQIGNGSINSFILLPEEDFNLPYYTELFATVDGAKDLEPFSDEYKKKVQDCFPAVKEAFSKSVSTRFDSMLASANSQLSQVKSQLEGAQYLLDADYPTLKNDIAVGESAIVKLNEQYRKAVDADFAGQYLIKSQIVQTQSKINLAKQKIQQIDDGTLPPREESLKDINKLKFAIGELETQIQNIKSPYTYTFDRFASEDYASYSSDSEKVDSIAKIFPVFFVLVAALVCLTTMTRMVEENRTQIGCLKALGYSKGSIIGKYMFYGLTATALGCITGMIAGFAILPRIIFSCYKMLYNIPKLDAPFRTGLAAGIFAVAVICVALVTLASCINELRSTPAQIMRPKAPPKGKRVLLERVTIIWNRLSFLAKVTMRNLFRYKKRFFMTVIGIAGCTALMVAGFGIDYSISSIADKQFSSVFKFDGTATLSPDTDIKTALSHLDNKLIKQTLPAYQSGVEISTNKGTRTSYLVVPRDIKELPSYVSFQDRKTHEKITPTEDGVIISEKLAILLDIKKGDTVTFQGNDIPPAKVKVNGINENYTMHYIYMSPSLYKQIYNKDAQFNTVIFNMTQNDEQSRETLSKELLSTNDIIGITYAATTGTDFSNATSSLKSIVLVLIICAGMLAFVVLYNLSNINITERARELATIKVLGFYDGEVSAYIYRENTVSSVIGIAVGLVLGIWLHKFVVITSEVDIIMFNRSINWQSFLYSAIFTFAFTLIVNLILHFKLKKIDMVESLKSIE